MKHYISMFLLLIVCFLLQTTLFQYLKIANVLPNMVLVVTAVSGLMYGRKMGIFIGAVCGLLLDLLYGSVVGLSVLIYVLIGYGNGSANKIYIKDDYLIPLMSLVMSDLVYSLLYYGCNFLLRGRFHFLSYFMDIMMPEMIYTLLIGSVIYLLIKKIDGWIDPPVEVPLKAKKNIED
ncbi:MAG: rod shape-determining protein MreD [Lachnospiraceae bacterium]|nr:rod shape-determining protein MreD [Lachnospiraceae bacterium]